jgi:hypothetical protein
MQLISRVSSAFTTCHGLNATVSEVVVVDHCKCFEANQVHYMYASSLFQPAHVRYSKLTVDVKLQLMKAKTIHLWRHRDYRNVDSVIS